MGKSEGAAVREAFDGPEVEHDALISFYEARIAEEHARSSDASESAAKVNQFLEETGLNSQACSWGKSILKKPHWEARLNRLFYDPPARWPV